MAEQQKISSCLWFSDQAEAAAEFYTSIFDNGKIGRITTYDAASAKVSGQPEGSVLTVEFTIDGYQFVGLNGGNVGFDLNPSISFFVNRKTVGEVDELWGKLCDGGQVLMPLDKYFFSERYGWTQDKYGVTWQVMLAQDEPKQKIIPSLLFVGDKAGRAEEAVEFYTSVFERSKKGQIFRYEAGQEPDEEGTIAYSDFELEGQLFAAMDSAQDHNFGFNEAISFLVNCDSQEEIDRYWTKLSAVPEAEQCGWLKDKFGVSWQIVPAMLDDLIKEPKAMEAMLQMKKLDIGELKRARNE